MSIVKFSEDDPMKKTYKKPLNFKFNLMKDKAIISDLEHKEPENKIIHEHRFKFTKNNFKLIIHEREKNMKEKVETLTKDMRNELLSKLEKTDQLRKLRESIFCKKMENNLKNFDKNKYYIIFIRYIINDIFNHRNNDENNIKINERMNRSFMNTPKEKIQENTRYLFITS